MEFYITDRTFSLQTVVSTDGATEFQVITTSDEVELSTGSRRMTMGLAFDYTNTGSIKEKTPVGNYVLYRDLNNKFIWMTILKVTHNPLTGVRTLECEDAGLDLLNETVEASKNNGNHNIAWYINKFTNDSGFEIGKNEIPNLTRTLEWDGESTALERVLSVATQFDNAEIEFSFEFTGNQLVKRKIDIYKKRGKDTNFKLYVNKDINSIETEEDIYQLVNAIKPYGGTPEGKDQPINLIGYDYTDPDGRFVVDKTHGYVKDTQNVKQWSRTGTASNYFLQYKTWTTTNQKELLNTTIRHLKQYSQPITNYKVDIANIPFDLTVGDYISIIDENEQLFLKSRVQKLTYDYTQHFVQAELSDFKRLESGISQQLSDLADKLNNTINSSIPYVVTIDQSAPFFVNGEGTITLTANVTKGDLNVTSLFTTYEWTRLKLDGTLDPDWSDTGRTITITAGTELRYTYILNVTESPQLTINEYIRGNEYLTGTVAGEGVKKFKLIINGQVNYPGFKLTDGKFEIYVGNKVPVGTTTFTLIGLDNSGQQLASKEITVQSPTLSINEYVLGDAYMRGTFNGDGIKKFKLVVDGKESNPGFKITGGNQFEVYIGNKITADSKSIKLEGLDKSGNVLVSQEVSVS